MDFTTLTYVLILVVGYLGFDAAMHPPDAILEGDAVGAFQNTTITASLVDDVLNEEVLRISATPSILSKPAIRVGRLRGLAMSVAEALKMQSVAYAFQAQLGYNPDRIKVSLYGEGGTAKVLVTGMGGERMASFQEEVALQQGETIVGLLQRATLIGMAHIDPYTTALTEIQDHADDKNFANPEAIIKFAMSSEPPTPENYQRALFENLNGLIALFKDDPGTAHDWFERAATSFPDTSPAAAVADLNMAFADMQLGRDAEAVEHIDHMLRYQRPTDKVLLSTAYMTLAAAQLGMRDVNAADETIAKAIDAYPRGSSSYDLWADIKREKGEAAAADRMHLKALENSIAFENYGEIATLYFRLAWRNNEPMMRSPFTNPRLGAMH